MAFLEGIKFALPPVNGDIATGIAQGTEAAIEKSLQLVVICIKEYVEKQTILHDSETVIRYTLAHLMDQCVTQKIVDKQAGLLLMGAYAALSLGLVCHIKGVTDGDWYMSDDSIVTEEMVTEDRNKLITECMSKVTVTEAATMIAATKVNWWKENHHTGQGREVGRYVSKAFAKVMNTPFTKEWQSVVHRLGHWCSTRQVLGTLGITGIIPVYAIIKAKAHITATEDVKLRVASSPAGTGRLSVLYAICKSFLLHPVFYMCPNTDDYANVKAQYEAMMANAAAHHVGGAYLTGKKAIYADTDFSNKLGRAVTWLKGFIPKSSISDSPHAKNAEIYDDFDPEFVKAIEQYKRTAKDRFEEILKLVNSGSTLNVDAPNAALAAWGLKRNEAINEAVQKAIEKKKQAATIV